MSKEEEQRVGKKVEEFISDELEASGIDPDTPAAREFRLRVSTFGILGVQPPRPELNIGKKP